MSDSRWYFTEEQLANSPSRKCGINAELELSYRQRAANLIQEMGQRLQVSQLCINTAIVYMHRFYAFHSFTMFHRNSIAAAAFFLAAKVEEQPRKLEHVIKILNICLEKTDMTRDTYAEQAQELVLNENILLQTLGFDVAIDHPHTHVVKACQLFNIVTVSRELRQTCYFMASNSLHLTTMCLKYRPTVVAAFCIYIACKWSRWEIPDSSEGKAWYSYVDESVTLDTLKKLTEEYLLILERSPSKFKSKMKAITSNGQAGVNQAPINISDGPSISHHKAPHHDKHHHHHHHKNNASMSNSAASNVNANGNSRSSSSKAQMHQMPNSSSSQYNKQQAPQLSQGGSVPPQPAASSSNMHRQRPSSSASQQSYSSSNSSQQSKPLMDERSHQHQQRLMHQDGNYYNSSSTSSTTQRMTDHSKHSSSSNNNNRSNSNSVQQPPLPQQPQPQNPPQPYMKMGMSDQQKQHSLIVNNKQAPPYPVPQGMDLHQKNVKQQQSSTDYHNRNNAMNPQMNQQIPNNPQKKQPSSTSSSSSWTQQQTQISSSLSQQSQHLQKNLQMSNPNILDQSASNIMNSTKSNIQNLSGYNNDMSSKQQQQQQQQNDFWFNDKINEMSNKTTTPPRQIKSLFSPSPEHDDSGTNEKAKYMMMTGSLKRSNESVVDSPKEEGRKSSTPTKREKSMLANSSSQKLNNPSNLSASLQSNQSEKKFSSKTDGMSVNLNAPMPPLPPLEMSGSQMKENKRSYSSIKDSLDHTRDSKVRKVEHVKSESNIASLPVTPNQSSRIPQQNSSLSQPPSIYGAQDQTMTPVTKQPIETNPEIVKSLLQECFSSNKFDAYDTDSPLDVINPEPPEELLAPTRVVSNNNNNNNIVNSNNNNNNNTSNSQQPSQQMMIKHEPLDNLLDEKDDKLDSSAGESSRKDHKKKSKKKHKHKKKHKSSDREDKSDSSSLKLIFAKDGKADTKSSPESYGGGLKIKIPLNKDVFVSGGNAASSSGNSKNDVNLQNPAPIKLKISKEKFGSFTNLTNNNPPSSSSSTTTSSSHNHHKKKDKDREKSSKSKSSKHYNSSDYKESSSYQHSN